MELAQVKSILHQTEVGELLTDGMGCSEPILSKKEEKIIDNFFVYFANKNTHTVSGPVARIGLQADNCTIDYLISCDEQPFSFMPKDTMQIKYPTLTLQNYEKYEMCYSKMRTVAFKNNCTKFEKKAIADYMAAFKAVIAPEMQKLYEEMVPSFFEWVKRESGE